MNRNIILVFAVLWAGRAFAGLVDVEKVSDRVLVLNFKTSGISNLVAVKGQKGLVMIDTEMSPGVMRPIKQEIEHQFQRDDWAYVVNTHAHMHHAGGNSLFKEAKIVGHDNLPTDMQWIIDIQKKDEEKKKFFEHAEKVIKESRTRLKSAKPEEKEKIEGEVEFWKLLRKDIYNGFEVVKPTMTFSDRTTLDLGDIKLELIYFGKGHSDSDIIIYIPEEKVLVTSGVCYDRLQGFNGEVTLADIERSISVLEEFTDDKVELKRIVPAHAESITKKELELKHDYYKTMLEGLRSAKQNGETIEQAKEEFSVQKKFPFYNKKGQDAQDVQDRQNRNIDVFWNLLDN
jgi:glyoxylase-like metal-dependent hydrolase (beta-lactamase superfamily II)